MYNPIVETLRIAKKAVEEPILMSCRRILTVETSIREFRGIRRVG